MWLLVLPGDCQTLGLGKQALIEAQPLGKNFVPAFRLGNLSLHSKWLASHLSGGLSPRFWS